MDDRVKHEDRLLRTERVVQRRTRQWHALMGNRPPRRPGRARDRSHLDCGRTQCGVCSQPTRPEIRDRSVEEFWREQYEIERELRDFERYENGPDWWEPM